MKNHASSANLPVASLNLRLSIFARPLYIFNPMPGLSLAMLSIFFFVRINSSEGSIATTVADLG